MVDVTAKNHSKILSNAIRLTLISEKFQLREDDAQKLRDAQEVIGKLSGTEILKAIVASRAFLPGVLSTYHNQY